MNRILRFIYAALIVSTAVACHTSEIDNPNNDNPDEPKAYNNIILTASIKQTRVDYSINGDKLEQRWAENDVIYGFYGDTKVAKDKKIVFTVNSVDESGVASLSPGDGWSDFLSVYKGGNLAIRLVYTGCTTKELSDLFDANGDILINMTEQGTGRIPACMHAESYDKRSEGDITYIQFQFDNDCSIIEVFSFTGVKEEIGHYFEEASATLDEIAVDGLIEGCKYSLDNNGDLQFAPIEKTGGDDAPTKVTLGGDWSVTKDGDITYDGNIKPVFIAAVPFEGETNKRIISVSATLGSEQTLPATSYGPLNFVHGNSYYIMADPVVARTVDGVYFKTVSKAFEHAEELSDRYTTAADNVVTLIKKEIDGLGTPTTGWWNGEYDVALMIDIDYNVTLDLNGCTLYLNYSRDPSGNIIKDESDDPVPSSDGVTSGAFYVSSGKSFKIQDSSEGDGECRSCSNCTLVINKGNTIVSSGNVYHTLDNSAVHNYGNLTVEGGNVYSCYGNAIINDGDATIKGGLVDSYSDTILNHNNLKVQEEGEVTSYGSAAICSEGGTVKITGGYIHANNAATINIYGGTNCDISGGIIAGYKNGEPTIYCISEGTPASTLTIIWPTSPSQSLTDMEYGEIICQPLIYSSGDSGTSQPVSTLSPYKNNTAQVIIHGGYLITSNFDGSFYRDNGGNNQYSHSNLVVEDNNHAITFGGFYSNHSTIYIGSNGTGGNTKNLYSDEGYKISGYSFYAYYQGDDSGFTMPEIGGSTGTLYKIDPGYPGTDLKPVEIGGVIWAPVNCGYDADHPYGLLYQWGRKYGQGYKDETDEAIPYDFYVNGSGPLTRYPDTDISNKGYFYYSDGDQYWYAGTDPASKYLWDANGHDWETVSSEEVEEYYPAKSDYDPCPDGWRVPSAYEFFILAGQRYDGADFELITPDDKHPTGGAVFYHKVAGLNQEELFLPAAGIRNDYGKAVDRSDVGCYWTSSVYDGSPWNLVIDGDFVDILHSCFVYGCSIRCVKE